MRELGSVTRRMGSVLAGTAVALLALVGTVGDATAASTPAVAASYSCKATIGSTISTITVSMSISGTTPGSVAPSTAVKLTGFQSTVTIPKAFVDEAAIAGASSVGATVKTFSIKSTDAVPATVNAAGKGWSIPAVKITKTSPPITVHLPATPKTVGSWVAQSAGTMTFTNGNLLYTLILDVGGIDVPVPVTCTPYPAATLSHTTVS